MRLYKLENDQPVRVDDVIEWGRWFESADRRVELTKVTRSVFVSTVFLGIDHAYGNGPPELFETRIFGGFHNGETWRYSTITQARIGHAKVAEQLWRERGKRRSERSIKITLTTEET